jgi:L-fuconolactonase
MQAAGVDACVLVEAGANHPDELHWFLELAAQHEHIAGVVGYIDLKSDVPAVLATIKPAHRDYLKGVRIGVTDPAVDFAPLRNGLRTLAENHLTCDLLIRNRTLASVAALAAAHPGLTFILDHFAGAAITNDGAASWRAELEPVAALPNTVMKVSGYLTAADPRPPTAEMLRPWFDIALELFGSQRLMYGSDWPVCLIGDSYQASVDLLKQLTGGLTTTEQADIESRTATKTYQLKT